MRFLGIGETCDLGSLYLRLVEAGHAVKVHVAEPMAQGTLAGLVPRAGDWRAELDWVREAGDEGIILFESVSEGLGELQDGLRRQGFHVIGGSAYGDRLENDRAYAQAMLGQLGFPAGHVWEFRDGAAADRFIADNPRRYVLKFSGPDFASHDNYVGQLQDGADVRAMLAGRLAGRDGSTTFVLMEFIAGIEMGVGAYFDGERFLTPACLDWEHKRFFAGDLGELTGEMGTVATYQGTQGFFDRTLRLVEPHLRAHGHVGYVNLNTIVNEAGIWPLEFTCRFGYPGFAILDPLQETDWATLLRTMATRAAPAFAARPGFCVGIVVTTPPFPYTRKEIDEPVGLPVLFQQPFDAEDRRNVHYGEVGLAAGQLVTSGLYGWTMVVTGTGATVGLAREGAYRRVSRVFAPSHRYRLDIGGRLIDGDLARLQRWGYLA
jgi:phosphoribosylamine--glycine ligase